MVSANIAAVGSKSAGAALGLRERSIVWRLDQDLRAVMAYHLGWIDVEGRAVAKR